jgi:mRNA interferase MazF
MPGATFDAFDVLVVPFPFTDIAATKRRPALVLSSRGFNDLHGQCVLAMITSAKAGAWPSDTPVSAWRAVGLTMACVVRLKLFTLHRSLIVRRLGALAADDRRSVGAALQAAIATA